MHVRTVRREDIPQLLQLYLDLNPDDVAITMAEAQDRWERLRCYPGSDIFVGWLNGHLVTCCTLVVIPNLTRGGASYALIENVVTSVAHRKRGYGKAVLAETIDAAWRAGSWRVTPVEPQCGDDATARIVSAKAGVKIV